MGIDGIFTLDAEGGGPEELLTFLKASAVWFTARSAPPTRQEFKLFLEGGWCDVVIKESLSKEVKDEAVGSVNDTKAGTLMFVRSQISAFESLLVRGNLDDSSFLGTETSNGKWVNITLDSFLDAATDDTDFQRGNYEESWRFLLNFYTSGQMID
eukprot:GEMP01068463.1.p1 GENE.GEMP01068463.1~~GEMP01068463.1.p1  ORF type:complete len:155 (+),score=33.70 GEMP01068463.1:103-567(+)